MFPGGVSAGILPDVMKTEQLSPDKRKVKLLPPLKRREKQRLTASPQGNTQHQLKGSGGWGGNSTVKQMRPQINFPFISAH